MLLVREGNETAFGYLVDRYRGPILNFVYKFLGDREAAEDVSQEVFVRLWKSARSYEPTAKFTTFLYLIARNLCLDYLDKYRRLPPLSSLSQEVRESEGTPRLLEEEIADPRYGPQGEFARRQLALDIEAAIQALPEDQRTVFLLTELQGMSYQQAAQVVGCPMGTVASRKSAAVKSLRDRLAYANYRLEGPA